MMAWSVPPPPAEQTQKPREESLKERSGKTSSSVTTIKRQKPGQRWHTPVLQVQASPGTLHLKDNDGGSERRAPKGEQCLETLHSKPNIYLLFLH